MFLSRSLTAAAAALLVLTACGKDDTPVSTEPPANALLDHVPAGTPYLSGNLQPLPDAVIDRFLERAEPLLQQVQAHLTTARAQLEAVPSDSIPGGQLARAALGELDGKLNRSGLERLGLDLQAPRVFYGLGAFPVFRMGLADADTLRATVQRVLDQGGLAAPLLERAGRSYWRLPVDDPGARAPAALYIAILDDQLAVGLFPPGSEDEMLDHLLGLTLPPASNAAERLQALNRRFGYSPYGTGEIDLLGLADELMSSDSSFGRALAGAGIDLSAQLDGDCKSEIRQMLAQAPRASSGLTELTPDVVGYRVVLETEPGLAGELAALVAPVPAADAGSLRALEFALGLRVGAVRDFLRNRAGAIQDSPYRCASLTALNDSARRAYAQLNQPIPPLVNNFQGVRLSINRVGTELTDAAQVEGVVAIHVDKPEMFIGMAQMFLPNLAELELVKGGPPVQLPASLVPLPEVTAFAALGETAIGLAIGEGEQHRLTPFLAEKADPGGTFLSMNYDMALYLDHSDRLAETLSATGGEEDPQHRAAHELTATARAAFRAMAGRTDTRLSFTRDGIIIDSRMTFK